MKKIHLSNQEKFKHLIFSVISMVLMLAGMYPVMAQSPYGHYTADDFRWEYSTDASTCENNGRIICLVINTVTGDTLNFVQGANPSDGGVCEMPDGARFELGSFQFRVEGSTEDFMSSPTSTTTASFAPGVYEVKWSAQMYNVDEVVPVPIGVSTTTLVEVQNAYLPSTLNLVGQAIAENSEMYGGRPSLPGQNTGRIQFQVSNPNFPLHFVITDSQNDIVLDKVLNGPMYSGTDAHRYDFATYYTFDSLAVGSYSLLLEDGCQKTNPKYAFDIREVHVPMLTDIYFSASAPNYTDSNIVHFYSARLSVDADVWDYLESAYRGFLQYRVCYGDIDTSDWKPFPIIFDQLTRNSDYSYYVNYTIYDTAHNMSSYCPLYGKYLTFQYRCTLPGQTDTITRYTQILEKFEPSVSTYDSVRYNQNEVVYDACSYRIPSVHEYTAKNRYSYTGSWNDYMTSSIPYSSTTTAACFTGPFTWQMIDTLTHETVKTQRTNYYWDSWEIRKSDMEALYGSISDTTITFPVKIVVTDAKNCSVVTYPNVTMYDRTRSAEANRGVGCDYTQWIDEYSTGYDMYRCCQAPTGIRIYEVISNNTFGNNESGLLAMPDPNRFKYMRDGMKIKVTRSPYENKYNFTATYSFDRNEWDVEWENEDHGDVTISVYEQNDSWNYWFGITMEENCFPYGDYGYSFLTACDTVNNSYRYYYGKEVIERTEDLSFTAEQNCMEMYIQLTGGQFSRVKLGADVNDPMQADEVWLDNPHELNTYVKVLGDSTGHDNRDYRVSDHPTIRLTKPGTYTLRMYTLDTSLYCRTDYFDTIITYESGVLYYEQNPTAFVCDAGGNTKGFLFCKAAGGMAPYTYTLYNANNELLGTNQTGEFLNLPDVHQNDHLTLYVSDMCGWNSTDSSIVMRDFKSSIVVWYNDESGDHQTSGPSATLKAVTKCEGTEITVNVSSINNLFNYRWYNKSGTFNVLTSEATVLIPRDAEADTYYVNVDFTECSAGFTDSIFVDVIRVPEVTITPTSPTVCPGGEVQLTFTPTNPNGSPTGEYVIGHENNSIVTFINYSDLQTHEFSYTATSPNRFWVHSVSDSICTYIIPEDTVLISLREMTSSCDVTVNSDTVCYGGDVTFTATSPTLGSAYTVKWYDTPTQDNLLDEKYIATSGETATFTLSGLTADTAVYVTVMDELHCETHSGTVQRYLNMGDSIAVHMSCGENVRLFDSGGSAQYYGSGEKDTITFSSADPTDRITLSFNSFDLVGSDKLYVYSGPIVHTDSLIATLSGSTIPSDISSNSNALTLRFRSDLTDQAEGWDAVVGCSATPAEARVHVLDSVDVSLTVSPELPARYGHSIDITATAHGGRSTNYQYVWQESTDNQTWNDLTGTPIIDGLSNTYSYAALNQSTYVRVIVTDASSTPCSGPGSAVLYLEVANIALSLTLTSDVTSICQETFAMSANVKNEGGETATGVSVRLNLPAGMVYGNPADTVIVIGDVDAGETVSKTFNVHNEIYVNTNTTKNIQAQIWSCDQGDGESVFQNWDWTRTPLENDEAEYQVTIHPSMDAMSTPGVSVDPVSVCYGQDATLTATPTISNPNIIWYADAALTEVVSTTNTYVAQQITEPRTYYVLAYNDEYCPSAAIVNHEIKLQYAVTDTLLMHNGTVQVGNNDHIRFYDDGGPYGNCTATSYTLLFTSVDGSPLEIYFDGGQSFNTGALAIYDGNSVMGTNLTSNTQITDGSAFTASSGMMLVKFSSYDEYHNGFSAHVFTITRPAVAEAVASSRIGDAQTITPTDAIVCYGDDATLYATSTVAAPQTFIWYASDLFTVVRTEPIDNAGDPSTYTVPAPQREETYYVTVVGDGGCPLVPQIHNNYREVLLNDNWQTTTLAASDSVCLYDAGGKDGDYTANCNEHNRYFNGPTGSKIRLHISNLQMEDGYLHVFWHDTNGYEQNQSLSDTQSDLDFESADNWMRIYLYEGCDYSTSPGLDAYVYAVMPQDSNNFAKARIKFKTPSFTDVNVTGSGAYCYGTQATLEASVENNTDELRYAWYDKNYNLLSVNSGVTDTYQPTITSANTYYVNASPIDQCPTLLPGYVTVLMNEASNGGVRTFAEGEAVHFYDEGGPDGNYSTYNNNNGGWTYTFKAPAGKRVRMDLYNFQGSGNENLSIYDGTPSSHQSSWGYCCNYENLNATFYAESGTMTVRWQNYTSSLYPEQIGWDALVGVENGMGHMSVHEVTMASADVTVKDAISPSKITTEDLTACYGTNGYLQASAPSLTGDLTFKWYDSDLIEPIYTETVSEGGTSQLPVQVLRNETYYVTVSNAENCAVTETIHHNYREVLMGIGSNDVSLAAEDSVCLYDRGGKNGDYTASCNGYSNYFHGPTGSKIHLHISSLQMDGNNDGYVQVLWHDVNGIQLSQTLYGTQGDLDFESEDNWMYVYFNTGCGYNTYHGLDAYVYAITPHSDTSFAPASVTVKEPSSPTAITTQGLTDCFGAEGHLGASAPGLTGDQKFKWYGPDLMEPIFTETVAEGETSQLPVQVSRNETYYVSVSNAENCEVLETSHYNYREVLLNDEGTTNLAAEDSVCIYDMGGKNDDYNADCKSYYNDFNGPSGSKVRLHISNLQMDDDNDGYIQVNWHNANGYEEFQKLYGTQNDLDFESVDNWMRVYIYHGCNGSDYSGLDAYIYAITPHIDTLFATADVTVKAPISPTAITTQGLTACYGTNGYLEASAPDLTGDQKFKWYGPDLLEPIFTETVAEGGTSQLPVQVLRTETYYVSVSNAENCEVLESIHNNYRELLMSDGGTTYLAAEDSVCLYDMGGKNGDYNADCKSYNRYFDAPSGSKIRMHISSLQMDYNNDGYVEVRWHNANGYEEYRTLYGTQYDLDFESADNWMQVYFSHGCNGGTYPGLDAYVYAITPHDDALFATAAVTVKAPVAPTAITTQGLTACYGTNGHLEARAPGLTGDQTFKWYDSDLLEPIYRETVPEGGTSRLPVQVLGEETYYVSVFNAENCEVSETIHNNYREVLMGLGGDVNLAVEDSVCLYDMGGKNGNYTSNCSEYYKYFYGPSGSKIRLHISSLQMDDNNNGRVRVRWHNANGNDESRELYGTQSDLNFESADNWMEVYFHTGDCNGNTYPGLDAYVYAITPHDDAVFATAQVSTKAPSSNLVNTQNNPVCFGEDVELKASSSIAADQYFVWFEPDRITAHYDTVHTIGAQSTFTVNRPQEECTYYVAVYNDTTCPYTENIHSNEETLLFTQSNNETTVTLDDETLFHIYDDGGHNSNYSSNSNSNIYFRTNAISKIKVHFDTIAMANDDARLTIYVTDPSWRSVFYMYGPKFVSDTDIVVDGRKIQVSFENYSSSTAGGFEGTVSTILPFRMDELTPVPITFTTPEIATNVVVSDTLACYGTPINLKASITGSTGDMHYVWYNENMNLMYEEVGVTSTYSRLATANERFFVNAVAPGQCAILPPNYNSILLNAETNGGSYTLAEGELIPFYDEGGQNGNYSTYVPYENSWTYTFKAPDTKQVTVKVNRRNTSSAELMVYDGTLDDYSNYYYCYDGETYTSTNGVMTFRWYTYNSMSPEAGWDILVYLDNNNESHRTAGGMAYCDVSLMQAVTQNRIVTQDVEACFGSSVTLAASASASEAAFPQIYTWYNSDRTEVLLRDTIYAGESNFTTLPEQEETYYIALSGDGECPVVETIHDRYENDVWLTSNGGDDIILTENNIVRIYDDGGPYGDYWHSGTSFNSNKTFRIETANSKIKVHFDTIALADNRAQLQVYDQQRWNTVFTIRGPMYIGDTTIVVDASNIAIYFNNDESTNTAGGFAGYVHAITPHSEEGLAGVSVSFAQPTINTNISVNDTEACFGDEAELLASSTGLSSPQVFAWFDEDYNFLKLDTVSDGQSRFKSQVLGNAIYYVNATTEGDCPVLPPNFGSIVLNAHTNGGSYTLDEGELIPFYDEGGRNGNYSTRVPYDDSWTYTFRAPDTKQVIVKVNRRSISNGDLMVYDGTLDDYNEYYYCNNGNTYTSTNGVMTFRWYTNNTGYAGWDIQVGVMDVNDQMTMRDYNLASANVSVKQPTPGLDLLVANDTVCYGREAHLTARATSETQNLLGYPQYFKWYAPDGYTLLLKDTVDGIAKTQSEFTAPAYYQLQDQNYYVTVGNHDNCPVVLAPISNVRSVSLNSSVHNRTTLLTASDAVKFYDTEDGSYYQNHNSDYTHTFQTVQGNLRVRFYETDKGGIEEGDTLYIYDAATADENAIIYKVSHMEDEEDYGTLSFVSTGKFLTFRFESVTSYGADGWEALIMPVNVLADVDTAKAIVRVTSVSDMDITAVSDNICMGQTAEVSASANISYPQYYVWYDEYMEVLKRDTLHNAAESPSMLPLPAHFTDASYYALVYSDTVNCMMNTSGMERIYSELPLTELMSGLATHVSPTDSIRVFTPNVIGGDNSESFQYYFTADTGLIQIHFDELMMEGSDIGMVFADDYLDIKYDYYEDGTYHDLTVTSLNNQMHLYIFRKRRDIFSFDATVTNIGTVNDNILSKLAKADVTIKMNNSITSVITTNDTVCYGSPALLTASAPSLGYPQYYTWYNKDMSQILYKDTIESGVSNYYVTDNMGRATYLVNVENDTTCPIYESTVHPNFREYPMLPNLHLQTLFVGLADSLVVYDEGGKDGDYSVDDRHGVAVILETYPGATFNIRVPTFVLDPDGEAVLAIFEYDEDFDGDEPDIYFYETQTSEVVYNSFNNRIVLYWEVDDEGDPAQGFEVSVTAQMHPEKNLAKANVELNTLPYMNTLALTADPTETTICQGDDVVLTATSTLPDQPQYFVWYNSDFTSVLAADTAQSGNEGHATIANLTQDTLVYVSVGTDEMCPAYPMDHKFNVQELYLTAPVSGDTTILTLVDSVLFYDEGGPDENYHSEGVRWMQTFTAANPNAHVKIYFKYIELNDRDCREDNWLAVVQGPLDFDDLMNNDFLHEPFVGEDGPLFTDIDTMTSTGNSLTVVWQSECYKGHASMGWEAYVYTDEPTNVGMDAFAVTKVNVNPSYRYTTYDSVCASATLYDVDRFQGIDISVPGDYTIDSVYHTSLGCDSIYSLQLHVHSNPVVGDDALVTPVACNGGSTGIIDMSSATVTGGEAPFTYTLFQNGTQMASFSDLPVGTYKVIAKDVHGCYSDSVTIDITEPDTLHLVSCPTATEPYHIPTGESYVTVEFEDPTFAPTLNNARITERQGKTANNQYGEGTHTITYIIQNDCGEEETCSVTFTVEDFDPLAVTLTVDSVTCYGKNNGAATVAITGGKPGSPRYTYTVTGVNTGYTNNNTTDDNIILSDLAPDRYTVHIEDMQGTPIDTAFNIGQPDTMVVTVTAPSVSCPNATSYEVSLTTTGGNGLNQYEWGADATNANATSTVVERVLASDCGHEYKAAAKVTDRKGCVATDTVSFVFEDLVKPNATMPADTTLCRNALTGAMEAPTSVTGEPTNLSDNCTSVGNLTVYSIDTDTTGTDSEPRVIHREWHVKDGCNNDSIKVQNITIRPSVLTENNITFTCPDMTITLKYGACDTLLELERTLINNMSDMTVSLDSTGIPSNRRYNVENSPYTITWRVTDECGSYVEYTQNVTVIFPPCGPNTTAIDGDGIAYPTVRVGCNCWTARNARSTRYTDGTPITPAPMQYPGTEQHPEDTIYCKLYTYNAATRIAPPSISPVRSMPAGLAPAGVAPTRSVPPAQVQGICPDGWHIPDDEDFADLMAHWEGEELNATEHWLTPGTNISGFTMEPGGCYNAELNRYEYLLVRGYLWSYTPGSTVVHACEFGSACGTVEFSPATMETGYSVRCVHNAE